MTFAVPGRFNFARDVVERASGPAMLFVDTEGRRRTLTFEEVAGRAARWAGLLRKRGLERGDRLLVLVGKRPGWHEVMLAALKAGAIAIPCSDQLRARDLAFRARHSGARLLVAERAAQDEIDRIEERPSTLYVDEAEALLAAEPDSAPTEDTLREWCRGRIARFKIPRYVRFVDGFPLTVTGKVQKFKMRELEIAERGLVEATTA